MIKNKNNIYVIYMHKNIINNKIYIGLTSNYKKRCTPGNYKSSVKFYNAIQKYGWNNFEHHILKTNLSLEEANYWEKYYINFYNSYKDEYGYNVELGGTNGIRLCKERNGFYNHKHTPENIKIMKEKKKGGSNPNAKPVQCINTQNIFPSAKEAEEWCHISRQNITRCCRGERPTAGKHPITGEKLKWRHLDD